ncbi:hypothetical protein KAH37_06485 [bacterium]|nr:hypothetical protein [bacterium]
MQFATIRPVDGRIHLYAFEKEYNRTVDIGHSLIEQKSAPETLKKYDFIDLILPAQDIFYFVKQYPPVNKAQLTKIIIQEISLETPFNADEMLILHTQEGVAENKTLVVMVKKELLRRRIATLGSDVTEKIRMIIPEQIVLFNSEDIDSAVFIGDKTITVASREGQFIIMDGIAKLYDDLRLQFPDMDDDEYRSWLETLGDISSVVDLSPDEIRAHNFFEKWLKKTVSSVAPWVSTASTVAWIFADTLPGNGELVLQDALDSKKVSYEYEMITAPSLLQNIGSASMTTTSLNFATEEFAYRGGMQFLRIRLFASLIMFFILLIVTIVAMQIRMSSLSNLSESINTKNRKITKEILGKEYPSLRQAVSVMNKTINGGGNKKTKNLHPYTALSTMEKLFPLIAFNESTIEIKDFSIKDGGKVRLTGESDTLDDINTMVDNLEKLEEVTEVNKGQINSRKGKNRFNITFEYTPKQKEPRKKGTKKKKKKKKEKK